MAGRRSGKRVAGTAKRRSRRQIFHLVVDDNGLIKSAAAAAAPSREDLPRSSNVATTPTPISLLSPLIKLIGSPRSLSSAQVSFAAKSTSSRKRGLRSGQRNLRRELGGEGERGCSSSNQQRYRTEASTNSFQPIYYF